ncbi:glutamate synthase-related protein [Bacillus velezensis]|nr:glutamate synthase-related protein [Bacillus velezensis]
MKNANRSARISVKLVSKAGVGTIAAGVAKALRMSSSSAATMAERARRRKQVLNIRVFRGSLVLRSSPNADAERFTGSRGIGNGR